MKFKSYAKLNLGLLITGKRTSGYHELYSIFQEIDFFDELSLSHDDEGESITLSSNVETIPLNESNTIHKAVQYLMPFIKKSVKIHIHKNIPSEAGLGGGSGNAAYTLLALNTYFDLNLSQKKLFEFAEEIGSDVPFFIEGKQALVWGRGEYIKPVSFHFPYHIVLLKPKHFSCSTAEIFGNYAPFLSLPSNKESVDRFLEIPTKENLCKLENHLERPTIDKHPIISEMKNDLIEQGAFYSQMTGSGSVVFGLFETKPMIKKSSKYDIYYTSARAN